MINYDSVRVYFDDGTETVIYVPYDESIESHLVDLCDLVGCDIDSIITYAIENEA